MRAVRIQTGHYGRTSGATGAYNPRLKLSEASMNQLLSVEIQHQVGGDRQLDWQFVGPDERRPGKVDVFLALHMDGSPNRWATGPSVGYPPTSDVSKVFAQKWKVARGMIPGSLPARDDNYTVALRKYYGFSRSYSDGSPVKMVMENGFVTNDLEAKWAIANRAEVASALIGVVRDHLDVTAPIEKPVVPVTRAEFEALEKRVERAAVVNARQAQTIHRLQARVTVLES